MDSTSLQGRRILVVEDEYLLAEDVRQTLCDAGADVVGPVGTIAAAALIVAQGAIDAAILDVNLAGEMVFPVADALYSRNVPFVFTTGYDRDALPGRFASVVRLEKPILASRIAETLRALVAVPAT